MPSKKREQPFARCEAKTRSGGICKQAAGMGTDHLGTGRCKFHAGCSLKGAANPAYKHGLYAKEASPEELLDYEQWMANFDILKPSIEETFVFYRMLKYAGGQLTSGGSLGDKASAMDFGLEALRSLSLTRQRYRQAMLGTDINIHFDNGMAMEICEAVAEVIHRFVPEEQQTEAENTLWALVRARQGEGKAPV